MLTGPLAVDLNWAGQWRLNPAPDAPADWQGDALHPLAVTDALRAALQPDDIIVLDGGEFSQWVRWGLRDLPNTMIWNGKFGAIGGAVPTALGAAVTRPNSRVIAIAGDGGVGYHLLEMETAARYDLPMVLLIGNDGLWATEWHLQVERYGPERTFETNLTEARYDRTAEGLGGRGRFITAATELQPALLEALDADVATCLNVRIAPLRSPAVLRH
jgi:acetolactate synthase-1/2/3 large subunit